MTSNAKSLTEQLQALRSCLEGAFAPDTALAGTFSQAPSAGHCAAVAAIVQQSFGGDLVSAHVEGQSHWFNRFATNDGLIDVDLTGDQFGRPSLQVTDAGLLYPGTVTREFSQLSYETLNRSVILARRAGLDEAAHELRHKSESAASSINREAARARR